MVAFGRVSCHGVGKGLNSLLFLVFSIVITGRRFVPFWYCTVPGGCFSQGVSCAWTLRDFFFLFFYG